MFGFNPNVGTYCAGVRVGNWFEDIALQEVGGCYNSVTVASSPLSVCVLAHTFSALF